MTKHDAKRTVVITGGGSGMGRAMARKFASAGDTVYVIGRRIAMLQETAEGHSNIHPVVADVTDAAAVQRARDQIVGEQPTIDVLVNNAGAPSRIPQGADLGQSVEGFRATLDANVLSVFLVTNVFRGDFAHRGGRIINISSVSAFTGSALGGFNGQAYSASKAAVHGISRTMMHEFAPDGITVNCIAPGVTDNTEFFVGGRVPDERRDMYLAKIPLKRFGEADEIAAAAFYLASAEAGFVTGEILNISGGQTASR